VELRHLRYFCAVAEQGNFSRAAEKIHLTQPALSRQVRDLEEEIGVPLFRRGTNSTTLTEAGEVFYEEARDLLGRADRAIQRVRGEASGETLRVGYSAPLTAGVFPRALERFQSERPRLRLELADLSDHEMMEQLASGSLDLALTAVGAGAATRGVLWTDIARIPPVLILSKAHPLAKLKRIPPARLRDLPLVGLSRSLYPEYHRLLRAILKPHGVVPQLIDQADGIASLFTALASKRSAAVIPGSVAGLLPASLALRPFFPPLAETILSGGVPLAKSNPHAEFFIRLLQEKA